MNNQVKVFNHNQFGELSTILGEGGKVYFDGNQVAGMLGYINPRDALNRHCKGVVKHDTLKNKGGYPLTIIPEPDLYRLIVGSKLPQAEKFEEWVFEEVLPSIRKHGGYMLNQENQSPDEILANAVIVAKRVIAEKERELQAKDEKLEIQNPKVEYFDKVLDTKGSMTATQAAKALGLKSAIQLNNMLHELGIQYKQSGQWHLYSEYAGKGYTETSTHIYRELNKHGLV